MALVRYCNATKKDGYLCTRIIGPADFRCGVHENCLVRKGVRDYILEELRARAQRMYKYLRLPHAEFLFLQGHTRLELTQRIYIWERLAMATFQQMTDNQIRTLLYLHGSWYIRNHPEPIDLRGQLAQPELGPIPPPPPLIRRQTQTELAHFASDKQNVHRKATVDQTIEIVNRVLKLPVPPEYRWNTETLSKTPGEIIVSCKLTPKAGALMTEKYAGDDDVYELGKGIYGKVLDSVWQYISNSDDKEQMCAILKQELQDNIGMCAQGNLSRLCNALAGYMEGIESVESPAEKLGRLIPPLMDIEDAETRIEAIKKTLADVGLPKSDWDMWLDACA